MYIKQADAKRLDDLLMSDEHGFSIDQLMELAGLAVAQAIEAYYDKTKHSRILVCCGPGNNGGDGLVAARHLKHFGFEVGILIPVIKPAYNKLLRQCQKLDITIFSSLKDLTVEPHAIIVDALFGFGFSGSLRQPFDSIVQFISSSPLSHVVSVDVPSGWAVDEANREQPGNKMCPDMLVSLTAPVHAAITSWLCNIGRFHILGGRFIPPYPEWPTNYLIPIM